MPQGERHAGMLLLHLVEQAHHSHGVFGRALLEKTLLDGLRQQLMIGKGGRFHQGIQSVRAALPHDAVSSALPKDSR